MKTVEEISFNLISHFEGCKLIAYQDSGGIWTNGLGSTRNLDGKPFQKGDIITPDQAVQLYQRDSTPIIKMVQKKAPAADPYQQAALVSFTYNVGQVALLKLKTSNDMLQYDHVHGTVIHGLFIRRTFEEFLARDFEKGNTLTPIVAPV